MTRDEALNVLGVEPGASRAEIAAAHRELAQMLHPDKFGENKRLRARAEQQMKRINEARDVLLNGAGGSAAGSGSRAHAASARGAGAAGSSPEAIRFEAEARARAAETARLAVVAQLRTLVERRRAMAGMAVVAAAVTLLFSRARGTLGMLVVSVASMLTVWGIVDAVMLSSQVSVLRKRNAELVRLCDAARRVAKEAARL